MAQHFSGATEVGLENLGQERQFLAGDHLRDRADPSILMFARKIEKEIFNGVDAHFSERDRFRGPDALEILDRLAGAGVLRECG